MISKKYLFIIANLSIISVSVICYYFVNNSESERNTCEIKHGACTFSQKNGEIRIEFLTPIQTEEEILLKISVPEDIVITATWIEGLSMYMGKTPVIMENYKYTTFLGSCNLATMMWQLNLDTKNNSGQTNTYSATFYTVND